MEKEKIYELIRQIPKGKVVTYKQIAEKVGEKSYRSVAKVIAANTDIPNTPCHRVVGSNGHLTGYRLGLNAKREVLAAEGVSVNHKDKIDLYSFKHQF